MINNIFGEFGGWIVGLIGVPSVFNIRIWILAIVGFGITEGIKITIKRLKKNNLLK